MNLYNVVFPGFMGVAVFAKNERDAIMDASTMFEQTLGKLAPPVEKVELVSKNA